MAIVARLAVIACVLSLAACSGSVDTDENEGLTPEQALAQSRWLHDALPVLTAVCRECHDGSMEAAPIPSPGFLAGANDLDIRETLIVYEPKVVNLGAAPSSLLLTKGEHSGAPAFEADQASAVLGWITAEAKARQDANPPIRTGAVPPQLCTGGNPGDPTCPINTHDLAGLGVPGASFSFVAQQVGPDLYLTNMQFTPGTEGLYVEHPIIESTPAGATEPVPDPIDRFFNVVINLQTGAAPAIVGTNGTATFAGFKAADPISLRLLALGKFRP
jgi:hypothetical protein